jgi:endo-1,4-beta-xylanase
MKPLLLSLTLACAAAAQTPQYRAVWSDPAVVRRIDAGIEANRMGWATLRFVDEAGKPASNVTVSIEQTRHQFLFGVNLFMLGEFPTAEENRKYEEMLASLFNYATAPFYWKALEPEPGKVRFTKDSPKVYRRPPPDLAVEFAERTGIVLKGHPLVWDSIKWAYPEWSPKDPVEQDRLLRRRIEQIAARYRDRFHVWDVVNEVFNRKYALSHPMPEDFVYRSFQTAAKAFPVDAQLTLNEANSVWTDFQDETSPFYLLIQNLRLRGARVDTIGMQMHFFNEDGWKRTLAGQTMRPSEYFRVLDRYADFRLPIHITEITIPSLPAGEQGEAAQAEMARNLYRLWFSHPAVEAITWWNLVDETAAPGEDKWFGGLLRRSFAPKPAWNALRKLIQEDWRTRIERSSGAASEVRFQGFYGSYRATVRRQGKEQRIDFRVVKHAPNLIEVKL